MEESNKRLIMMGIFVIGIALLFSLKTGFYFGYASPGALVITGIILIMGGLVLERAKRNRNDNQ
jgi:hypothetical protein